MSILLAINETAEASAASEAPSADLLKVGHQQFMLCGACHGQQGEGTAAGPPLAGSEWVNGPVENLIRIQLRGLTGPITVKGQEYNFPAGMMAMAYQTDDQIAGVLTYIRSNFGNDAPPVTPGEVAALRDEVGKPQLVVDELIQPVTTSASASMGTGGPPAIPAKYANMGSPLGVPFWLLGLVFALTIVSFVAVFKK
jgi:mono/diheme cytochrome c family protein